MWKTAIYRLATTQRRGFSTIVRIGTDDKRMSNIVRYQGIVYTSGQVDTVADDSTLNRA